MVFATFNIVLVIYRTCAIGRVFRMLILIATFNNVSVFYHTCAVVRAFRTLSILFQSFIKILL
jgi:hypothetical protein